MRRDLLADTALVERVRTKYRMKKTTGSSLNALVDFERPIDILRHLLVGSEGTLAFIAEAVLPTVPDGSVAHTVLLGFDDIREACRAIDPLRDAGATALDVMDRAALRAVERRPGRPAEIGALPAH